jgi:hypothetical protein
MKNSRKWLPGVPGSMLKSLALSAVFLTGIVANAMADDFLGGEGGSPFGEVNCPRGKAIVGLTGRAGLVIDQMQLICGTANRPEDDTVHPRLIGASFGGGPTAMKCPAFQAVKSIHVEVREFQNHFVISTINIECMLRLDGARGPTLSFGNFHGDDAGNQGCNNPNSYAAGLAGRSGNFIDAVGITVCVDRRNIGG